jgi:N-acylneuraminate cytidylyltransferase
VNAKVLAIIPARGGSKGIPRKNIQPVGGRPLLAHTIHQARQTPAIQRVVVSTDDAEIAAVAGDWGAEVITRPPDISGDTATSESALVHALTHLRQSEGYEPDLVVFLQATSPLRRADDIQKAIETLQREQADSLFSACLVHGFVWRIERGQLSSFSYDYRNRQRRQDAPEDLIENGSIYVFKPWVLRELNNRLGGKIAVYRMDPLDSFQVDEPADIQLMSDLMSLRKPGLSQASFADVRLLVLDFDGVMTDNRVLVAQDGAEAVLCNRSDGWGLGLLKQTGVEALVLSTEKNPVVAARCRKLDLACVQGCDDKLAALQKLAKQRSLTPAQVAYVGNDANDADCLRWVGLPIAVADARPEAREAARWITTLPGGAGAVREVCDQILYQKGRQNVCPKK